MFVAIAYGDEFFQLVTLAKCDRIRIEKAKVQASGPGIFLGQSGDGDGERDGDACASQLLWVYSGPPGS